MSEPLCGPECCACGKPVAMGDQCERSLHGEPCGSTDAEVRERNRIACASANEALERNPMIIKARAEAERILAGRRAQREWSNSRLSVAARESKT